MGMDARIDPPKFRGYLKVREEIKLRFEDPNKQKRLKWLRLDPKDTYWVDHTGHDYHIYLCVRGEWKVQTERFWIVKPQQMRLLWNNWKESIALNPEKKPWSTNNKMPQSLG